VTVGYLFDLDETLVTYDPGGPGIFREACRAVGIDPTDAALEAFGPGYVETFRTFEESPYVGAARAVRETGLDIDPARFADAYIEAELAASRAPDGIAELLAATERVGVVTNGYGPVQRRKLSETGLANHVDALVCPDDVEAFKPDDPPFDAVTAAVPADEYVMVGDSIEYDIRPAVERGYRTVFVGDDDGDLADYRVSHPEGLPTMLDLFGR
jgi:putative hydrolase of the HAD superfamily